MGKHQCAIAACSEEIEGQTGVGFSGRQGVLDNSQIWAQGVGARRMLQRYVGEKHSPHERIPYKSAEHIGSRYICD